MSDRFQGLSSAGLTRLFTYLKGALVAGAVCWFGVGVVHANQITITIDQVGDDVVMKTEASGPSSVSGTSTSMSMAITTGIGAQSDGNNWIGGVDSDPAYLYDLNKPNSSPFKALSTDGTSFIAASTSESEMVALSWRDGTAGFVNVWVSSQFDGSLTTAIWKDTTIDALGLNTGTYEFTFANKSAPYETLQLKIAVEPPGIIMTVEEVGDNVEVTTEGSFDTTGLQVSFQFPLGFNLNVGSSRKEFSVGGVNDIDAYIATEVPSDSPFACSGACLGPNKNSTTLNASALRGDGRFGVALIDTGATGDSLIYVARNYSGGLLQEDYLFQQNPPGAVFENETLKTMQLFPGEYVFKAANESFFKLVIIGEAWTAIDADAVAAVVGATNPTIQEYEAAGINGAIEGNRSSYASALADITFGADEQENQTIIQDVVDAYNAILAAAGDSTAANVLSAEQYSAIGVTTTSEPALALLNNAVAAADESDVDAVAKLSAIAAVADNFVAYAQEVTSSEEPAAQDYTALGFEPVDANVPSYNSSVFGILSSPLAQGFSAGTSGTISALITAYDKLLAGTALTEAEFEAIGVTFSPSPSATELALINDAGKQANTAVGTVTEVQAIVTAAQRLLAVAGGADLTPALTLEDFQAIGVIGVTATNLASVVEALDEATASDLDTVAKLTTALGDLSDPVKVAELVAFDGTGQPPAAAVYEAAGVGDVDEDNLSAYASALAAVDIEEGDIQAIQAVVDTYNDILAAAESGIVDSLGSADYAKIGVTAPTSAAGLALLNNGVAAADSADVDSVAEVQAIADAADRLATLASAGTGTPTADDYSAVGITAVEATNAAAYNSAVKQTEAATAADIQKVVTAYNTILAAAGSAGASGLTAANYSDIGVEDVTATTLGLLNSAVGGQTAAASNTVTKLQAMATAAARILATASTGQDDGLTAADFAALGIQGVDDGNLAAAIAVVAEANVSDVQTIAALQALLSSVLTPPLPVPTLSFWAMLMLAMLMLAVMARSRPARLQRHRSQ